MPVAHVVVVQAADIIILLRAESLAPNVGVHDFVVEPILQVIVKEES